MQRGRSFLKIPIMKYFMLPALTLLCLVTPAQASQLSEPDLNQCNGAKGINKCEVKCARSLGDQCLITHINFEGENLKTDTDLIRARFLTCKNANLDLQISTLAVELEKLDDRKTGAKISSHVSASGNSVSLKEHKPISFSKTNLDTRLPRTYFGTFLNSGDSFVEATLKLDQCGHEDGSNSCRIYGKLVAVTDPNIRCDFHDTSKSGAYVLDRKPDTVGKTYGAN